MQFNDLKKQYQLIEATIQQRINTVLEHGKFIMGPEIQELEEKLAAYVGSRFCVSVSSGTDALLMSLMAHDVGPGDAIFTTPFTFISTAEVISLLGATPIFVDIEPKTFNIDPKKLKQVVSDYIKGMKQSSKIPGELNPKGVIAVDLFGLPADYDTINEIAHEYGLFVIEDAAQSFGGKYKNKMACNLTDIAATSFFPAKPLGCYGDGGAIFTNDENLAKKISSLRIHGQGVNKYDNVRIGINGRLDTLQAAILLAKLELFNNEIEKRQSVAEVYSEGLNNVVEIPYISNDYKSVWAQYSILSDNRDKIKSKLNEADIPSVVYYVKPLHLQTAFSYLGYENGSMPVSEKITKRILSLPMHPYLERNEQETIIEVIKKSFDLI
jgi:UDP-2-acetamido-2-deoxy-ribo-hexuluronate aminotransferase